MSKKKAVYLIGAGPLALYMFHWARELGLSVVATDRDNNAAGKKFADYFACIDASDHSGKHELFLSELNKKNIEICGVYCGNEMGTITANRLQQFLGLPRNSIEGMLKSADKVKMKKTWTNLEIKSPKFHILNTVQDLSSIFEKKIFKDDFILKPSFGSGSRGVQIVSPNTTNSYGEIWRRSMEPVEFQGSLLVEEYKTGRQLDANGIFINNKYFRAGTLERFICSPPDCLPIGGYNPAIISKELSRKIHSLLESSSRALGLNEGPVKGDFIYTSQKELFILEVAPRLHGDVTTCNTLPFGSGCNPIKFLFKAWMTNIVDKNLLSQRTTKTAAWRVLCIPPGSQFDEATKKSISKIEKEYQEVTKIWLNPKYNSQKKSYTSTAEIPGYICVYGEDQEKVEKILVDCLSKLNYSHGKLNNWYHKLGEAIIETGFDRRSFGFFKG